MRERYWTFFYSLKHRAFYYQYFQRLLNSINWAITAFLSLTSLSCIATWQLWDSHRYVWTALICISQVIQALFPKLPYNELLVSTKFMISALDGLLIKVEHDWLYIDIHQDELSEDEILKILNIHQAKYSELVSQFFSGAYLPNIKYCDKHAESDCKTFFNVTYHV